MQELDNVVVAHNASAAGLRERLGRDNLPLVVDVLVAVTSDLLTFKGMLALIRVKNMTKENTLTADSAVIVLERIALGV